MTVEIVHWNPRRPLFRGRVNWGPRIDNFGDLLGPVVVERVLSERGLSDRSTRSRRLLAVGSILKLATEGDTLWGIGANGKSLDAKFNFADLDVRAVRGPLTRAFLLEKGIAAPEVFGDPGLLVGSLWDRADLARRGRRRDVTIVPNLHDHPEVARRHGSRVVDPTAPLWKVIGDIAAAEFVVGSSLHGIVVAECLGVPARLVTSAAEPEFKYLDYFRGSGREATDAAPDVEAAIAAGGAPAPRWDPKPLLDAFPEDLFRA